MSSDPQQTTDEGPTPAPRIGRLNGAPPYRAWELRADRRAGGPWGIQCAGGFNCVSGLGGSTFLPSQAAAEAMIRSHGHEPMEPTHG
jgi:hypothetical protein